MKRYVMTVVVLVALGALTSAWGQYLEATIPVGDSPMWPMWSPLGNKVYVANTQDGTVSVIDGATNSVIATIPVEDYPDMFALNTVDGKVYCPSGNEDRLNVICAYGDTLIRRVRLTGYPSWPAHNERRNKLYVGGMDNDRVYALDGSADTVVGVVSVRHPMWLSLQQETDRLLIPSNVDNDTLVVLDCSVDTVMARQLLARASGSTPRVGLSGKVYAPCEYVVEVYSPDCEEHLASVSTPIYAPWSSAYCPATAKLYVGDFSNTGIAVVDCHSDTVVDVIAPGQQVRSLLCDTARGRLYVLTLGYILVYDTSNDSLRATVRLTGVRENLAWNPVNRRLYTCGDGVVKVIRDTTSGLVEEPAARVDAPVSGTTVVRGALLLAGAHRGDLIDATGRIVADLSPGANDLGSLSPGVYFARLEGVLAPSRFIVIR